ncbi:MAG TPA: hypothetical protein VFC19_44035 [Candidatus Limnocylindrales bacterium]|nr:hypothetical protein [Candidatus Limnocylindrales bacterium]
MKRATLAVVLCTLLAAPVNLAYPTAAAAADGPGIQTVAKLHLLDLKCLAENDSFGSDEPYININGQRVWSRGNVDRGDIELVDYRYDFDEVVTVELWEDDGGLTGGDDLMGRWFIFSGELGSGFHTLRSQYTAGLYDLRYEVVNP